VSGRGSSDKSERRNNHPPAKPSDLDQFANDQVGKRMAKSGHTNVDNKRGG
jgi:hypothetical protein